jgi:signal transduction histidine kinase
VTNVTRHAEAQAVHTSLYREDEDLMLVVEDDGKGFRESEAGSSLGVLGMKERAAAWGGSVQVSSSPGKGTKVAVRVPVHAANAEREGHEYSDRR